MWSLRTRRGARWLPTGAPFAARRCCATRTSCSRWAPHGCCWLCRGCVSGWEGESGLGQHLCGTQWHCCCVSAVAAARSRAMGPPAHAAAARPPQDEPFTPADWDRHRSWARHCPEPRILVRVLRTLAMVEIWVLAVSVFAALYAHFLQARVGGRVGGEMVGGGVGGWGGAELLGAPRPPPLRLPISLQPKDGWPTATSENYMIVFT